MKIKRREAVLKVNDHKEFIFKALSFARSYSHFNYFNNNNLPYLHGAFPNMLMIGVHKLLKSNTQDPFKELQNTFNNEPDWYTGYFSYDLKNYLEKLSSSNIDHKNFSEFCFYQPEHIILFNESEIIIKTFDEPGLVLEKIESYSLPSEILKDKNKELITWRSSISVEEYHKKVNAIKEHIVNGDIYELNFCLEFFSKNVHIDPIKTYFKLNSLSPMPFSLLGKYDDQYLICSSPERFLKKHENKLISQPIKGTARRGKSEEEDLLIKDLLFNDEKERAENLMIVDLVRNDLARSSVPGSVKVQELFKIYTFQQVHQMISTVISDLREEVQFTEAIKNAFPMGSMTGAPKVKVMELIEQYENTKRGIYAGASGYISPSGNFDFNVIIRSLFYDDKRKTLSFQVGSAITYDSIPEKEYEECLLKAEAMMKVFG